LDGSAKKLLHT
jgi:hypothetical protein